MKEFFRTLLAVLAGLFIAQLFGLFVFMGFLAALGEDEPVEVHSGSVLTIDLSEPIADYTGSSVPKSMAEALTYRKGSPMRLFDALEAIRHAASDENIEGIVLEQGSLGMPLPNAEELRRELEAFRAAGKFVYAFADNYSQGGYYLASVADSVFLHPAGGMDWAGMSTSLLYFGKTFEKFGIEPQIIRHGKFKSAVEPFMQETISEANREQNERMLSSMWGTLARAVSASRNVPVATLDQIANEQILLSPEAALRAQLVDGLRYRDQLDSLLMRKTLHVETLPDSSALQTITLRSYARYVAKNDPPLPAGEQIAVLYASGVIEDSKDTDQVIGGEGFAKVIASLRKNCDVRGVVLRVNSPGGSALASETIWRELLLLGKEKPLVVSMGEYAASGGYYISSPAHWVVGNETTLTGSIGVFGMYLTYGKAMRDYLGVNPQVVKTHASSDIGSPFRPLTAAERSVVQQSVEQVYSTFIDRVAQGREMAAQAVDSVGQGRVWSGVDAKQLGLLDSIGGLRAAIEMCAQLAEAEQYYTVNYPQRETDFMDELIESAFESVSVPAGLQDAAGLLSRAGALERELTRLQRQQGVRAQMLHSYQIR